MSISIEHERTGRHGDNQIPAFAAMTIVRPTRAAFRRAPMLPVNDGRQAVGTGNRANDDVAAVTAVAAVRPTFGHVLLAPEAATPAAAIAALDV